MKNLPRYLYGLATGLFLSGVIVACSNDKPTPPPATNTVEQTEPLPCEEPGQSDDQGRPIPQC